MAPLCVSRAVHDAETIKVGGWRSRRNAGAPEPWGGIWDSGALTPDVGHRRDLDLDGPGERSPCGDEALPAEFKADAVALYRSRPGATIKSVVGDLGVNTETLRNWIRAAAGRRSGRW
ncbi:transposase [Streptomyces wedmorensis]|uniref:transposase n=1 Tax=Streptomyces wedmorensis TaxID=43759 RepID=UPI00342759C9